MGRIKQNKGRVVYSPLSYIFQMVEKGGTPTQKFDAITSTWVPNRLVTPYLLQPQLLLSDPDGIMPSGDYSTRLVNATWSVRLINNATETVLSSGAYTYQINSSTKAMTLTKNVDLGNILRLTFTADYIDTRRNEVAHFTWTKDLISEAQSTTNITLETGMWRSKVNLSPFKNWGQFSIGVQLKNGNNDIPDADATYQWQWWDKSSNSWSTDFSDCLWLVSGEKTKSITVDQDYIQNVILRVMAYAFGSSDTVQYFATRLRRWYGQYEEDVDMPSGKYVFADSNMVVIEGKVTNRWAGNVKNPTKYFDMELFFAVGNASLESVGYGEEAVVCRNDLQTDDPRVGIMCRELTSFVALELDNGKILTTGETDSDEKVLVAQLPTTERNV